MSYSQPATESQYETLRQLGVPCRTQLSRVQAEVAIQYHQATDKQRACLAKFGVVLQGEVHRRTASDLIQEQIARRRQLPPTERQRVCLQGHGAWREGLTRGEASDLIGRLAAGRGSG